MANFISEFKNGKKGSNVGIPFGPGLESLTRALGGLLRGMMYGIASAPKVGKSTFVDYAFVIQPYLYALEKGLDIVWIYFSYEMDRVTKEFDFSVYFLYRDFGIKTVTLPEGVTVRGESIIWLCSDYLRGRLKDDNDQLIVVNAEIEEKLKEVYYKRIIPIFGEYAENGTCLKKGLIRFIEHKENPTGLRNKIIHFAEERGKFTYQDFTAKDGTKGKLVVDYIPDNPAEYVVIIYDTLRKIPRERGFSLKENVDKMIEYSVELRNKCQYTFVPIIHLNRSMTDVGRMKFMGDMLYPNGDDIKDTGNLSEEANHMLTMFNPNDDRYNLSTHFGRPIKDKSKNLLYPQMRTLHLVESRNVTFPQHFAVDMNGALKSFKKVDFK